MGTTSDFTTPLVINRSKTGLKGFLSIAFLVALGILLIQDGVKSRASLPADQTALRSKASENIFYGSAGLVLIVSGSLALFYVPRNRPRLTLSRQGVTYEGLTEKTDCSADWKSLGRFEIADPALYTLATLALDVYDRRIPSFRKQEPLLVQAPITGGNIEGALADEKFFQIITAMLDTDAETLVEQLNAWRDHALGKTGAS